MACQSGLDRGTRAWSFMMSCEHVEAPGFAIGFQIAPRDELVACKHRHAVVAVLPLVRWLEDLEHLLEAEQRLDAVTVPQDGVER